jgi:hypothetical protein
MYTRSEARETPTDLTGAVVIPREPHMLYFLKLLYNWQQGGFVLL